MKRSCLRCLEFIVAIYLCFFWAVLCVAGAAVALVGWFIPEDLGR